jgi:hypothetical protein
MPKTLLVRMSDVMWKTLVNIYRIIKYYIVYVYVHILYNTLLFFKYLRIGSPTVTGEKLFYCV